MKKDMEFNNNDDCIFNITIDPIIELVKIVTKNQSSVSKTEALELYKYFKENIK